MLCPLLLFVCLLMSVFVVDIANKFKSLVQGHTEIPGKSVTGMKFGLRKRQQALSVATVTGDSGNNNTSVCTDNLMHFLCACTVVFLWKKKSRQS